MHREELRDVAPHDEAVDVGFLAGERGGIDRVGDGHDAVVRRHLLVVEGRALELRIGLGAGGSSGGEVPGDGGEHGGRVRVLGFGQIAAVSTRIARDLPDFVERLADLERVLGRHAEALARLDLDVGERVGLGRIGLAALRLGGEHRGGLFLREPLDERAADVEVDEEPAFLVEALLVGAGLPACGEGDGLFGEVSRDREVGHGREVAHHVVASCDHEERRRLHAAHGEESVAARERVGA